jgi:serine/threonine-protein kinase
MTTTDLGACEWFVWDLRRSNLIDRGQLDQVVVEFLKKDPRAEPAALAQYLVDQEILTPFQAERLLHGKTQGLVLGPYALMDALGTGSMGTVYKAQSKTDGRWYAVKVLPRRSMWNVRIARRQVRSFEQIHHPAVVPFVDVGTAGSTHYLAWPLVEGQILETILQTQGKLPTALAARYALQTAEGLAACHQHDIYHGLLKPSNLMVSAEGQIRILDFGIGSLLANAEGESLVDTMSTANSVTSGLDCASPECIMEPSNRTPAGDQYSLGCVLYFCLTGQYPFPDGTAVEKMMAHQTRQPTPVRELVPEVPEDLAAVVERLMKKAPEARFPRSIDIIDALKPFAAAATARPVRPVERAANSVIPQPSNGVKPSWAPETPAAQKPVTHPNLPTRQSLRGDPDAPTSPAPPTPGPKRKANPYLLAEPGRASFSLEEKLGPVGLILGAVLAAAATWLLSLYLFHP